MLLAIMVVAGMSVQRVSINPDHSKLTRCRIRKPELRDCAVVKLVQKPSFAKKILFACRSVKLFDSNRLAVVLCLVHFAEMAALAVAPDDGDVR